MKNLCSLIQKYFEDFFTYFLQLPPVKGKPSYANVEDCQFRKISQSGYVVHIPICRVDSSNATASRLWVY